MVATTRASARRASAISIPALPTPHSQSPPGAAFPVLGGTVNPSAASSSSLQRAAVSTHADARQDSASDRESAAAVFESRPTQTSATGDIVADGNANNETRKLAATQSLVHITPSPVQPRTVNRNGSFRSSSSSSQPVGSPALQVSKTTRQERHAAPAPPKSDQITWTLSSTFSKDINDPYTRKLVDLLQHNHSWAPAKLCHSMLVGCRYYQDANEALRKFTFELLDDDDESEIKPLVNKRASTTPGVFSRAERQRAIASSTETQADRERVSFVANAVLYRAFAYQGHDYGRVLKQYSPRPGITMFSMISGLFPPGLGKPVLSKELYLGTTRGKFQPLSFNSLDDGRVVLQSVGIAFPYVKTSFEELRFGDYIRGRKKAPHLFDLFRKLPAEIRCMIWRFAMQPRTVELRYNYRKAWTVAKIPAALSVSREARYEALKRYALSFGIGEGPAKTYFDFKRDTLFLTYEKWHGEGDYEGEIDSLTHHLVANGEAKKIRSLAIDRGLVEILASILEADEEEWYAEGDDDMPMPEIEVIPNFESLESLAIVKTTTDGFWEDHATVCGCSPPEACEIRKRGIKNDNAVFVPAFSFQVANPTQQEYYKQLVAQIKGQNSDWSVPELSYMVKQKRSTKPKNNKAPRRTCNCGDCYPGSD